MDLLHTHTQWCLGQDLFTNMNHRDIDLQMTLIFNIVLYKSCVSFVFQL